MSRRKRVHHPLNTPLEIQQAIASNDPYAFKLEEWDAILRAAKAKRDLRKKRDVNKKRHRYRNPAWPSTQRSNEWFARNRREVRDEPKEGATSTPIVEGLSRGSARAGQRESFPQPIVAIPPAVSGKSGYDLLWERQQKAEGHAEISKPVKEPAPPVSPETPEIKLELPLSYAALRAEIARREAAGTWDSEIT